MHQSVYNSVCVLSQCWIKLTGWGWVGKLGLGPEPQVHSSFVATLRLRILKSLRIPSTSLTLNLAFHVHSERLCVEVGTLNIFSNSQLDLELLNIQYMVSIHTFASSPTNVMGGTVQDTITVCKQMLLQLLPHKVMVWPISIYWKLLAQSTALGTFGQYRRNKRNSLGFWVLMTSLDIINHTHKKFKNNLRSVQNFMKPIFCEAYRTQSQLNYNHWDSINLCMQCHPFFA